MPALARPTRARKTAPLLAILVGTFILVASGCPQETEWPDDETGFDDHTVGGIADLDQFHALAAKGDNGTSALKFVIVGYGQKQQRLRILDSKFFQMHDEWYWFRLLNGQRVPGSMEQARHDTSFASVSAVVEWARSISKLPYGMRWVEDRLYSDYFYELSLHRDRRVFGIGTLLYMPEPVGVEAPRRPAVWAFELEYSDTLDDRELGRFFSVLSASLPDPVAANLKFIARSPHQERLVADLRGRKGPLSGRLLTYAELAVPGAVEVYNPGLIAGRLRKVPRDPVAAAAMLSEADEDAILLMGAVPDELPMARGLITATPQTPLAHVNLLARNRGIPNAYYGGSYDDPNFDQLSRVHAPVVVLADAGKLRIVPISEEEYGRYLSLVRKRPPVIARVDTNALPWTMPLDGRSIDEMPDLRPTIGGKAAGFLALLEAKPGSPPLHRPTPAMAITVRAYADHLVELRPKIASVLTDGMFFTDARLRLLLLEGRKAFSKQYASEADAKWLAKLEADHPPDRAKRDAVAWLLDVDGVQKSIRDRPLDPTAAAAIEADLRATYSGLSRSQGLRFRSSSSIEDIEGFNGAGLYDSNTGFLFPAEQADEKDRKHDFAWALRRTWSSYWSFPAFEERRLAGIDHLAGNMGVLVHPRFDDPIEEANGVVTLTWGPARGGRAAESTMMVNVQAGELSVANPSNEEGRVVRPEFVRVTREAGQVTIERLATSTEVPAGTPVLDDARLQELLAVCERITERWHTVENAGLPAAQRRFATTLDLEFRVVAPGWPARTDGRIEPQRLIVKQARSLEPAIPAGAETLSQQPIPRDVLSRASRVDRWQCQGGRARVDIVEVLIDSFGDAERGLPDDPFVARIRIDGRAPVPDLEFDHLDLGLVQHPGFGEGRPWSVDLTIGVEAKQSSGVERIVLDGGLVRIFGADGQVMIEEPAPCTRQALLDSPQAYLRGLLDRVPE